MSLKVASYYRGSTLPPMPGDNVFHSDALFHLLEQTPGCNPVLITVWRNGQLQCRMLAMVQTICSLLRISVLRRCVAFGAGEYFCAPDERFALQDLLVKELKRYADRTGCLLTVIRNLEQPLDGYAAFKRYGFFAVNWMQVCNPLQDVGDGPIEQTFSTSRRRQIKKGLKNGAEVCPMTTQHETDECLKMLHGNSTALIRRHFLSPDFFGNAVRLLSPQTYKAFLVKYRGKVIGCCICLYSTHKAYVLFSRGLRKSFRPQHPGELAVWAALTDARQRGLQQLEFVDVGVPFRKHGYREFVLRFGGEQAGTRRWFNLRWVWLNNIFRKLYS